MININLLPPQLKLQRIAAKRNASLIGICIVIVILFLVTGIVARSFESTVKANLDTTTSNVEKNTSQLDEYSDLQDLAFNINDRAKTADEISKNRTMWSQILQELSNSAPGDVQFENLIANADKSPNFVLQGNTTTEREIIKFKDKLENSSVFNNVSFKTATLNDETNPNIQTTGKLKFTLEFDMEQRSLSASVSGAQKGNIK